MSELKYTEKLMDSDTVFKVGDNPAGVDGQAFDTEIEHYLGGLMKSIESHWGVHLHGDDRGAIAWEAVAKWVVESLEDAEKEIGYCGCSFCEHNKKHGKKYDMHVKELN